MTGYRTKKAGESQDEGYEEYISYGPYEGPATIEEVDGKGEWESYKIVGKIQIHVYTSFLL